MTSQGHFDEDQTDELCHIEALIAYRPKDFGPMGLGASKSNAIRGTVNYEHGSVHFAFHRKVFPYYSYERPPVFSPATTVG
jgi:hypothetical protein